ncbi:hypothetical protein [Burkholderia sp. Ac-20344]|uniref:hypothetical protein n=1 Tax=Burkholderia sp. Ac-20344 TaxID=2703890 RepID=UPI00197BA251|nr:hypothetical protein [Burkholderia sp. Ac-20344]MBN3830974.1 hypothetical protein [Burkholderia sp. Ac-20344]
MKNTTAIVLLILVNSPWIASPSYAQYLTFNDGMKVHLPAYENKIANPDGSDSVCVDVKQSETIASICIYNKTSDKVARDNGFIKYRELPPEGKDRIPPLSDDALIYFEAGYSALYEAREEKIGDFIVYEADNTLCDISETSEKRPAVCYVAALAISKKINSPPAIFVSAVIEPPPLPAEGLARKQRSK